MYRCNVAGWMCLPPRTSSPGRKHKNGSGDRVTHSAVAYDSDCRVENGSDESQPLPTSSGAKIAKIQEHAPECPRAWHRKSSHQQVCTQSTHDQQQPSELGLTDR